MEVSYHINQIELHVMLTLDFKKFIQSGFTVYHDLHLGTTKHNPDQRTLFCNLT